VAEEVPKEVVVEEVLELLAKVVVVLEVAAAVPQRVVAVVA
jgi:hypothetical protein